MQSLSDEDWTVFILQLCSPLEEPNPSTAPPPPPHSTATRSKLNLLCYLCCVVGHKVIANKLMNSTLVRKTFIYLWFPVEILLHHKWLGMTRWFCSFSEYFRVYYCIAAWEFLLSAQWHCGCFLYFAVNSKQVQITFYVIIFCFSQSLCSLCDTFASNLFLPVSKHLHREHVTMHESLAVVSA